MIMSVKQVLLGFVVVGCVCGANAGSVVYQNDFSRRTSIVKPGPWRELNYVTGARLAYSYATTRYMYTDDLPWACARKSRGGPRTAAWRSLTILRPSAGGMDA